VLIADEMGVGKTVQAMALASCYQVGKPSLALEICSFSASITVCSKTICIRFCSGLLLLHLGL